MCTFNLAIDDDLVDNARSAFTNKEAMTSWLEDQISDLLEQISIEKEELKERKPHKHDVLRGILRNAPDLDYKRIHLEEKYGI